MTCKTLAYFLNALNVADKYSLLNRDKLTKPIKMQLSEKQTAFSEFFSTFLKSKLSFEHFQKKGAPHS